MYRTTLLQLDTLPVILYRQHSEIANITELGGGGGGSRSSFVNATGGRIRLGIELRERGTGVEIRFSTRGGGGALPY